MKGLLGRKIGMTQIFLEDGTCVPVTVIECGPCYVVQKKVVEKDGYNAIQLGFMKIKPKRVTKPLLGHFKKANLEPLRYLREIRVESPEEYKIGQELKVGDVFKEGEYVDVTGISKGKGFAGVMKMWGFSGAPASHGTSKVHRKPGSIGASTDPGRVFKGKRMPGRMGCKRVTIKHLEIVKIYPEKNVLLVKGAVPGCRGGLLIIKESKKVK